MHTHFQQSINVWYVYSVLDTRWLSHFHWNVSYSAVVSTRQYYYSIARNQISTMILQNEQLESCLRPKCSRTKFSHRQAPRLSSGRAYEFALGNAHCACHSKRCKNKCRNANRHLATDARGEHQVLYMFIAGECGINTDKIFSYKFYRFCTFMAGVRNTVLNLNTRTKIKSSNEDALSMSMTHFLFLVSMITFERKKSMKK